MSKSLSTSSVGPLTNWKRLELRSLVTSDPVCNPAERTHWLFSQSSTLTDRPNSNRAQRFASLVGLIRKMATRAKGDEFYLDPDIAKKAETLLAHLNHHFESDVPKIFPHEGEAVLTWDTNTLRRYLTIEEDTIDHTVINKLHLTRCSEELTFEAPSDLDDWIMRVGGIVAVDSDTDTVDAL